MNKIVEENYLKCIYALSKKYPDGVSTNSISDSLKLRPSSVSVMIKKMGEKKLVEYTKYRGVILTDLGKLKALKIVRKHRLWETFLVEKFGFKWDEVHEIAEQLEHIESPELVNKLDAYLGYPKFDPHGDPIPNKDGEFLEEYDCTLDQVMQGQKVKISGVKIHTSEFLKYLESLSVKIGSTVEVIELFDFDKSLVVRIDEKHNCTISNKVSKNLLTDLEFYN